MKDALWVEKTSGELSKIHFSAVGSFCPAVQEETEELIQEREKAHYASCGLVCEVASQSDFFGLLSNFPSLFLLEKKWLRLMVCLVWWFVTIVRFDFFDDFDYFGKIDALARVFLH